MMFKRKGSKNDIVLPVGEQRNELKRLAKALRERNSGFSLVVDGVSYNAPLAVEVLRQGAEWLSEGIAVEVDPYHLVLTEQRAADFLHTPREYVRNLIERGELLAVKLETGHYRVKLTDVIAYRDSLVKELGIDHP